MAVERQNLRVPPGIGHNHPPEPINLGDDEPLWGALAIGKAVKRGPKSTVRLLERGVLPGEKVGGLWVSTRRRLMARLLGTDGFASVKPEAAPPIHMAKSAKRKLQPRRQGV